MNTKLNSNNKTNSYPDSNCVSSPLPLHPPDDAPTGLRTQTSRTDNHRALESHAVVPFPYTSNIISYSPPFRQYTEVRQTCVQGSSTFTRRTLQAHSGGIQVPDQTPLTTERLSRSSRFESRWQATSSGYHDEPSTYGVYTSRPIS